MLSCEICLSERSRPPTFRLTNNPLNPSQNDSVSCDLWHKQTVTAEEEHTHTHIYIINVINMLREAAILLYSPLLSLRLHTYIQHIYTFIYSAITSHPFTAPPPTGSCTQLFTCTRTLNTEVQKPLARRAVTTGWVTCLGDVKQSEVLTSNSQPFTLTFTRVIHCESAVVVVVVQQFEAVYL